MTPAMTVYTINMTLLYKVDNLMDEQSEFAVLTWSFIICLSVYMLGGYLTIRFECTTQFLWNSSCVTISLPLSQTPIVFYVQEKMNGPPLCGTIYKISSLQIDTYYSAIMNLSCFIWLNLHPKVCLWINVTCFTSFLIKTHS